MTDEELVGIVSHAEGVKRWDILTAQSDRMRLIVAVRELREKNRQLKQKMKEAEDEANTRSEACRK